MLANTIWNMDVDVRTIKAFGSVIFQSVQSGKINIRVTKHNDQVLVEVQAREHSGSKVVAQVITKECACPKEAVANMIAFLPKAGYVVDDGTAGQLKAMAA